MQQYDTWNERLALSVNKDTTDEGDGGVAREYCGSLSYDG